MRVPKRRPPSPHSCNWSRSPLRQFAAAKPSQVMKPNSTTKTMRAVQLTSATASLPRPALCLFRMIWFSAEPWGAPTAPGQLLVVSREIDDRGQSGADDHPQHLVPIEERNAGPIRLRL